MKKLITILLLFLSIVSYGQTKIEVLMFDALNEYRGEHGVKSLIFNDTVLLAAEHHNTYLNKNGYPSNYIFSNPHQEDSLVWPDNRLIKYGSNTTKFGECIVYAPRGLFDKDDSDLINRMISWWDSSPTHKKVILDNDFTIGAISIVETEEGWWIATLNVIR